MYADMEFWSEIRRRVLTGEISKREACKEYEIHWKTLVKILTHEEPPGYRRVQPPRRPTIEPVLPVIRQILDADAKAPRKQRHTAKRIWQRLRDEHGFTGGYTVVKDAVLVITSWRLGVQPNGEGVGQGAFRKLPAERGTAACDLLPKAGDDPRHSNAAALAERSSPGIWAF